jgi:hypothetical protein
MPYNNRDQAEDPIVVAAITLIVREAAEHFERVGGSSRQWVRECFLPVLNRRGWFVDTLKDDELGKLETGVERRRYE